MPGFNRTGPMGFGPMTGGRRGLCDPVGSGFSPGFRGGYRVAGDYGPRHGFRFGNGFGSRRGRGFGGGYNWYQSGDDPYYSQEFLSELDRLRNEAGFMRKSLDEIRSRISEIENRSSTSE